MNWLRAADLAFVPMSRFSSDPWLLSDAAATEFWRLTAGARSAIRDEQQLRTLARVSSLIAVERFHRITQGLREIGRDE